MKMHMRAARGFRFVDHEDVGDRQVYGCLDLLSDDGPDGLRFCLVADPTQTIDAVSETTTPERPSIKTHCHRMRNLMTDESARRLQAAVRAVCEQHMVQHWIKDMTNPTVHTDDCPGCELRAALAATGDDLVGGMS